MTDIIDTIDELTPEWLTSALRDGGTIGAGAEVTSAQSELIGTGQLGLVVQTRLQYAGADDAPATVVVKLPSTDEGSRGMGAMMGVYESEVRFYEEIAPRVGAQIPHKHWGDIEPPTGRFTLVIDDLSHGASAGDMVAGGTPEQAALAIGQLAPLQAPVWDDPALRECSWLDFARTDMLFGAVAPALDTFVGRFGERLAPEHLALVEQLAPLATTYRAKAWAPPYVVAHGDYRLDNMMFGTEPGAPAISIIDWQAARLAPPMLDAAIYMSSCMTPEDRRAHEDDLLAAYHADLVAAGVEGFSPQDCRDSYGRCSLYTLLLGISVSVTLVRTERGDAMWARLISGAADLALDTDAAAVLL